MFSWFSLGKDSANSDRQTKNGAEETSSLTVLLPSAGSTSNPSLANIQGYGAAEKGGKLQDDDERSNTSLELYTPLQPVESLDQITTWNEFTSRASRRRQGRFFLVVSITAVLFMVVFAFHSRASHPKSSYEPSSSPSFDSPAEEWTKANSRLSYHKPLPFSVLDPVKDLGLNSISHGEATSPPSNMYQVNHTGPLPTSAWYQNLMMNRGEPGGLQRVYTSPLVLDLCGPIPGLRAHPNHIGSSVTVMQLSYEDQNGITIGIGQDLSKRSNVSLSNAYSVLSTTPLGISLQWNSFPMTSSIVRGMPFTTMHYPSESFGQGDLLPTIKSQIQLREDPIVDGLHTMRCNSKGTSAPVQVSSKLRVSYKESDFTWLFFFSQPVMVRCVSVILPEPKEKADGPPGALGPKRTVDIQVVKIVDSQSMNEQLTIRAVLLNNCTIGLNPLYCQGGANEKSHIDEYEEALEKAAPFYPGPATSFQYNVDSDKDMANLYFDWDVHNMVNATKMTGDQNDIDTSGFVMFALPHHLDRLGDEYKTETEYCKPSLIGKMCLVRGDTWALEEPLVPMSFRAPRPPRASAIKQLAESLSKDIDFRVHGYFRRGAGDTYFSGKLLAKHARVILIADEVRELCNSVSVEYKTACANITLPSQKDMKASLDSLRAATEIWINGTAETPFVYESAWGGVISCGCYFNGKTQKCDNHYPECPSVTDPGLNFGNGFYNDHHFHYGYHIYAAATVAYFDRDWGRKHFERVLLLIRDFANPSELDPHFPVFRQKDWYQGHSWASGIPLPPYLNGKNQESSSESIAGYESVALFGMAMIDAWDEVNDTKKVIASREVRDVGRMLTATEIRSTDRYYHIRHMDESKEIYPRVFSEYVVGVMWNMMAQFQTWFGSAPFLAYGIQLLPLTPVSESRDDALWLREMYKSYADSCNGDPNCAGDGWSIMQLAMLASVGHVEFAIDRAMAIPAKVFTSAGGNGHSLSNTLWYLSTRADTDPIELPLSDTIIVTSSTSVVDSFKLTNCGCNISCTEEVLDRDAMGFSCGQRINWLIKTAAKTEIDACITVGGNEFPNQCGPCNPNRCDEKQFDGVSASDDFINAYGPDHFSLKCPPCSTDQCQSRLNNCPLYPHVFVCSSGPSKGGCSDQAWDVGPGQCQECCELTTCKAKAPGKAYVEPDFENGTIPLLDESSCPPCSTEICRGTLNTCNIDKNPFLCVDGRSLGGCDSLPWKISGDDCHGCCKLSKDCKHEEDLNGV